MRQLLKQTISVTRPTSTQGDNFDITPGTTTVVSGVAASIQPATSSVQLFYAQRQLKITQTIFVAYPLSLLRGDRISDGTVTYVVVGWRDQAGRNKVQAIDVEEYVA